MRRRRRNVRAGDGALMQWRLPCRLPCGCVLPSRNGRKPEALQHLSIARRAAGDNPISNYSIGAVYYELGEFDLAVQQAHKAAALGFPGKELENALKNAKQWRDPAPVDAPDTAASAASAASAPEN